MRTKRSPKARKAVGYMSAPRPKKQQISKNFRAYIEYLEEPLLQFGYGQKMTYPRDGLFLFGPVDSPGKHASIKFGVIGTPDGLRRFRSWSQRLRSFNNIPVPGLRSREVEPQHVPFPGFAEAFRSEWPIEPAAVIDDVDPAELSRLMHIANRYEAVHGAVDQFVDRLIRENNRLENPPSFWFVVIPEVVYELGRPQSVVPKEERTTGEIAISQRRAKELKIQPTLFGTEDRDATVYEYALHFRRQLKARLLKDRIVTQIVRETTLTPGEFLRENGMPLRRIEDPATIAWKLGTGAYYKSGGKPWQLADVRAGVCYVGLVYKRSESSADSRHACCAAQMFLSDGEGVVFRGALGPWFHTDTKQFHLDQSAAKNLITMVLEEYKREHSGPPAELFIHATSTFCDEEWAGFAEACDEGTNLVGVQIVDTHDDLKLFRPGAYPVIRGTVLVTAPRTAYLWTSGYVPRLDTYMGPETPNPIQIRIQRGSCELPTVLKDILGLTKINFNSCLFNDRLPVTIRFANAVGDVLMSAPIDCEPRLPFKFYI